MISSLPFFSVRFTHIRLLLKNFQFTGATPGQFTIENTKCREDGKNCNNGGDPQFVAQRYIDPSRNVAEVKRRLAGTPRG